MQKPDNCRYDAVIIGAGIGGLVCGCYLAKAGLRVLIAEKHHKPGGYCTSFTRRGFTFDAAAHSFGGYRDDGLVNKVLHDFKIEELIEIKRFDPSDIVITPDYRISFWADVTKTLEELSISFPNEHYSLKRFFQFITMPASMSLAHMRKWTLKQLLDTYFTDERLKTILAFPLFGNGGLPPSVMSAFIGINILREFLLDGGYYPDDNMQSLPDALSKRFLEYGGELKLSSYVSQIVIKDRKSEGIIIAGRDFYPSKCVISNSDMRQTYLNLIEAVAIHEDFLKKIKKMTPSLSMFIIYLGLNSISDFFPPPGSNVWLLSQYDLDKAYRFAKKGDPTEIDRCLVRVLPNMKCIMALVNTSFQNSTFWKNNKERYLHQFVQTIEQHIIPDLNSHIVYRDAATPITLFRYTLNYKGAAYGWASIPEQIADVDLKKSSDIQNLYNVGHWTTQGLGIPGVVYSAFDTAKRILKKRDNF